MSTAYFLFSHRDHEQVVRLFKAIYHPGNVYLVHWDAKSSTDEYEKLRQALRPFPNVHFLEPRESVFWGGDWSLYNVELRAMTALLELNRDWSHLINLSGQCFPLMPEREIAAALTPGRSYIERVDAMGGAWKANFVQERFFRPYLRFGHRYISLPWNLKGLEVRPWGNSQFKILAREAVNYLVKSAEAIRIRNYLKKTLSPDETVAATTLFNSPLAESVEPSYRHYIDWNVPRPPKVLAPEDLESIDASGAWFCRKVEQGPLLDILEARLIRLPAVARASRP